MEKQTDFERIERSARVRRRTLKTVTYALLTVWGLIVLFPFYWMLLSSVKSYSAYNGEYIPKFFTLAPTLENYGEAFTAVPLARYFLNTLIFTLCTTAVMLAVTVLAAFAFSRLSFRGRNAAFAVIIHTGKTCRRVRVPQLGGACIQLGRPGLVLTYAFAFII